MRGRINSFKILGFVCVLIYAFVFFQIFAKNLVVNTDYPFHMHNIWATTKGYLFTDPFLQGGEHIVLEYGAPIYLLGAALYPILGKYTVSALLIAVIPALWYSSKKMSQHFCSSRVSRLAAIGAVLNPFTVYFILAARLPFMWGVVFAVSSIYFFLERKSIPAILLGALSVIVHPLSALLFGALLMTKLDIRRWLKTFFIPFVISGIEFMTLFGPPSPMGAQYIDFSSIMLLGSVLGVGLLLDGRFRKFNMVALGFLTVWVVGGFFGFWLPTPYFNRLGFFAFLVMLPFLIEKAMSISYGKHLLLKSLTVSVLILLTMGGVYAGSIYAVPDNAQVYENLSENVISQLRGGYVHYASDGSALYFLPMENIKFSNSGREVHVPPPENVETYAKKIRNENVSYIIVYGTSPEENMIQALGCPLIYSSGDLRIYETPSDLENSGSYGQE